MTFRLIVKGCTFTISSFNTLRLRMLRLFEIKPLKHSVASYIVFQDTFGVLQASV